MFTQKHSSHPETKMQITTTTKLFQTQSWQTKGPGNLHALLVEFLQQPHFLAWPWKLGVPAPAPPHLLQEHLLQVAWGCTMARGKQKEANLRQKNQSQAAYPRHPGTSCRNYLRTRQLGVRTLSHTELNSQDTLNKLPAVELAPHAIDRQ